MKLSASSVMVVFDDLAAIEQGADHELILLAPAWGDLTRAEFCRRRRRLVQFTTAGAGGRRPGPRGRTVTNAARRVPALGERQAESGRIGLLAFPWDQEALQSARHEAEQQGRLVADHLDRMRHTAGKSRVGARPHLDAGIADPRD